MRRWFMILVAGLLFIPVVATAQQPPAQDLFPTTEQLGEGWELQSAADIEPSDTSAIERLSEASYLGPKGSRVYMLLAQVQDGPAAVRTSWELMGASFEALRLDFDANYSSERELEELPGVDGCADMRRMTGKDGIVSEMQVAVSLCAADPDVLLLVYVSGEVNGLTGYQASDALVALVLNQAAEATPTPE